MSDLDSLPLIPSPTVEQIATVKAAGGDLSLYEYQRGVTNGKRFLARQALIAKDLASKKFFGPDNKRNELEQAYANGMENGIQFLVDWLLSDVLPEAYQADQAGQGGVKK